MKRIILCLFAAFLVLTSCQDDDTNTIPKASKYVIMAMTDLSTTSGLLFSTSQLPSGTVNITSVTSARQLASTRNGGISFGNAVYTGTNSTGDAGIQKYTLNAAGQLSDAGFISSSAADYNTKFHIVRSDLGFYSDANTNGLKIQIFNPATMARTGEIDLSAASKKSQNSKIILEKAGERMIVSKEGKLYIDIQYDINNNGIGASAYDAVYVAVVDIATSKYEKLISYDKAQEIAYPPMNLYMAELDEKGDLYINTMGNMLSADRNSKILRIKKGETEFDKTFEISIDDYVPGKGIKWFHGGAAVLNGKIITGIKQSVFAPDYSNFNEENIVFHAIDVNTKVATPLAGVPKTDYITICTPFVVDGKVWIPYSNAQGSGMYTYDGTTAQEQFKLSSGVVSGFYQLSE